MNMNQLKEIEKDLKKAKRYLRLAEGLVYEHYLPVSTIMHILKRHLLESARHQNNYEKSLMDDAI